jgi:hypothetical protein
MEVWRRRGEAASARLSAAPYSAHHGLYSEAVVSSVASAVVLVDVGRFREAVVYVQRAAKALYEAAKEVFEQVKVTVQRLVELFDEAVTRVLAWVDEHKAYLFLMAAGVVALSAALDMWGLVELDKLAYAASLTPFIPAGVKEYSREEVFKMLREASDPYERFKEIAKAANAGRVKLAEPWESLRALIMPKPSEERRLMKGKAYRELDERRKKALFYATLALEEAFGVYRSALGEYAAKKVVQRVEVGEEPFKRVVHVADLLLLTQLSRKEEAAFEDALKILRERLNEYAVKHGLRDLLDVNEDVAKGLAEAEYKKLPEFSGVNFGTKAYAALIAYREYALGRRDAFGSLAWHLLEVGGSAWLLYYAPKTAYKNAEKAKVERPVAVEEMLAEAFRRLFLKPGADHYSRFVEELTKGGKLALMPEEAESSYMFRLFRVEEGGGLKELGIKLRIREVGEGERAGIVYALEFDDVERWRGFFGQELEVAMKAAGEVGVRLPVEDGLLYMVGWVDSDVAISGGRLVMGTSHLWQLAETHALFGWSNIVVSRVGLTLEGPKPQFDVYTSLERLDEAIRKSAGGGWLNMLGTKAELKGLEHVKSWDDLKRWVADHWGIVVDAAMKRLGEEVRGELEALRNKLNDDKVAREIVAPALLLIQAENLGVNETTLRHFAAAASGTIGGDGYVSAAMREVGLASGERAVALLWKVAFVAYGVETEVETKKWVDIVASGGGAAKLAGLYFLYGPPLLEGDERIINHKLAEAVELAAMGLDIRWEGLRRTDKGRVAADLTISVGGIAVKYNVYLSNEVKLQFNSTDQGRVELTTRLLRLADVDAEVKKAEVGGKDIWYVEVSTDKLAAGRRELREALIEIVKKAVENGWVDADRAERWLEKLEEGLTLREGWPKYYVGLSSSGGLEVRFSSTNPDNIEREAQRLRDMGLEEGRHFMVKMPGGGREGYVSILKEGLAYAAWLSEYGSGEQQRLAAKFVKYILQRAWEAGEEVYEKAKEIIEEGKARSSLTLKGFEERVEVGGKEHVVKVIDGGAEFDKGRSGKKLLRIKITAEVNGVRREYEITFGRRGRNNAAKGSATARANAPGGREADAERFSALVKALTGKEPRVIERSDGRIDIICGREHLEGFKRYTELADAIKKWLEETRR